MSNIVSTKSNAIFLAAILVAGTFVAISPSSFIIGVKAQTEPYYEKDTRYDNYEDKYRMGDEYDKKSYRNNDYEPNYKHKEYNSYEPDYGMDKRYNSYESQYPQEYKDKNNYGPDYPLEYTDDKKYNSYKPDHYGMDNDYGKKTYGYEQKYPSYEKDDKRDKSKKDSKSVNINKIKCINTNLNINGNNAGNVSIGNKGAAEEGYLGSYSSTGGSGYGEGYYDNGYSKQGKGFDCIINNNNNNINIVAGPGDNATDGDGNVTDPCEECFRQNLTATQFADLEQLLGQGFSITIGGQAITVNSLEELCEELQDANPAELRVVVNNLIVTIIPGGLLNQELIDDITACLAEVFGIEVA